MKYDQNDCQQFYFITPRFSDTFKHTKNKSWRRCRVYFRGRMQCWWIFDFETNYTIFIFKINEIKAAPFEPISSNLRGIECFYYFCHYFLT
jgi:hypothetical protein